MKVSTAILGLALIAGGYWLWQNRDESPETFPPVGSLGHSEDPPELAEPKASPPNTLASYNAEDVMELATGKVPEQPPVEPIAPHVAETIVTTPVSTLDPMVIREVLTLQRGIDVPHALAGNETLAGTVYINPVVTRIDPDGIHIRHAEGISKIFIEEMHTQWRAYYHMDYDVAMAFRAREARRDYEAWRSAQERRIREEERTREILHEGHLAAEQRREQRRQQKAASLGPI